MCPLFFIGITDENSKVMTNITIKGLILYPKYGMMNTQGGENVDDIKEAIQLIGLIVASVVAILTGIEKVLSILLKLEELNRK